MKILVAGLAKTGTTGLFYKIKNSLPLPFSARELFESRKYEPMLNDDKNGVVAKILLGPGVIDWDYLSWSSFDKKILIIRDPRDRFISYSLYRIIHSEFYNKKNKVKRFIESLRKKEFNPDSVGVLDLTKLFYELNGWHFDNAVFKNNTANSSNFPFDFLKEYPDYFIIKYEDFIAENLKGLEKYLGFKLTGADAGEWTERVLRTKNCGDWKNWLTEEDVKYFKPLFIKFMDSFGYLNNWKTNKNKKILSEHCSDYVLKIVSQKLKEAKQLDLLLNKII